MHIRIFCVGKIKNKFLNELLQDYLKKINHYCKCEHILIREDNIWDKPNESQIKLILQKEAKRFEQFLQDAYNIALVIDGNQYSSIQFSNKLSKLINEHKCINFFIGSSYGLDGEFLSKMNEFISFSKMTFPHQLFQLLLSEQIYRAFTIIKHTNYHK